TQVSGQAATLVLVGDFEKPASPTETPVPELMKQLTGWKSDIVYERISRPAKMDLKGSKDVILTPDKKNALYVAAHNLALTDNDPDYAALEVANFLFGGGPLSSRLANRVRQKEGLAYGVASGLQADP